MTAHNKQALREHYSPKPVPKCHICGAEMTIQRMSVIRTTYGCTGATYDDKGCHYAEGRSIADDHYAQSHVTVVDLSDPEVLAVLDELEATESKCRELAAENAGLKEVVSGVNSELYGQRFEVSGWHLNGALEPLDNWFTDNGWGMPETPATDAFLAEVRASCVESAINTVIAMMNHQHPVTSKAIDILRVHAAQLRKGAAL